MFSTAVRGGKPFAAELKSREVKNNIQIKAFGREAAKDPNHWK